MGTGIASPIFADPPVSVRTVLGLLYVWAVGGNDVYLPEFAGLALSGDSDVHYVLVEMHYDVK